MIYIISQDWGGTKGNHAGMVYLFDEIHKMNPKATKTFVTSVMTTTESRIHIIYRLFLVIWYSLYISLVYKNKDTVILTEYLSHGPFQELMASIIRFFHPHGKIIGIIHLLPDSLDKAYTDSQLRKHALKVDRLITLGSSLTSYLHRKGIENVETSFHYVDKFYLRQSPVSKNDKEKLKVIVMGFNGRRFEELIPIIKKLPEVDFVVCNGNYKVKNLFSDLSNVRLTGYMLESDLRKEMSEADVSLNVMDDTVGSNVICTSLGMGLAIVVSDVGSIHDYCDDTNAVFCSNSDEFVKAISTLSIDRNKLYKMKLASLQHSTRLQIPVFFNDLDRIITNISC